MSGIYFIYLLCNISTWHYTLIDTRRYESQYVVSTQDSYSFLVPEDVGSNSVVAMVTVTDLDTMMRGEVMFDLQRGGDFSVRGRRVDDAQTWVGEITTTTVSGLNSS